MAKTFTCFVCVCVCVYGGGGGGGYEGEVGGGGGADKYRDVWQGFNVAEYAMGRGTLELLQLQEGEEGLQKTST